MAKIKKIMVVDDENNIRTMLANMIRDRGYDVVDAGNGPQAMELLKKDIPDLILLDVLMPGMDGFELCKLIKENDRTKNIKVIMLSARVDLESRRKGINLGAEAYLPKPVRISKIIKAIEETEV